MAEDVIVDAENFQGSGGGKEKITYPLIVLLHVQKCSFLGGADHQAGGYWSHVEKIIAGGITSTDIYSYNESKGRAFENAVLTLYDLLSGHADGELDDAFKAYQVSVEEAVTVHNNEVSEHEKEYKNDDYWYMRQATYICGLRARLSRVLFRACLTWLKNNHYLTAEMVYEGADTEL